MARPTRIAFRIPSEDPLKPTDTELHEKMTQVLPSLSPLNLKEIMWHRDAEGVVVMLRADNQCMFETTRNRGWKGIVEAALKSLAAKVDRHESVRLCVLVETMCKSKPTSVTHFQVCLTLFLYLIKDF